MKDTEKKLKEELSKIFEEQLQRLTMLTKYINRLFLVKIYDF